MKFAVEPTITYHPASQFAKEGEKITLECRYKGTPYPVTRVLWTRDNMLLKVC